MNKRGSHQIHSPYEGLVVSDMLSMAFIVVMIPFDSKSFIFIVCINPFHLKNGIRAAHVYL